MEIVQQGFQPGCLFSAGGEFEVLQAYDLYVNCQTSRGDKSLAQWISCSLKKSIFFDDSYVLWCITLSEDKSSFWVLWLSCGFYLSWSLYRGNVHLQNYCCHKGQFHSPPPDRCQTPHSWANGWYNANSSHLCSIDGIYAVVTICQPIEQHLTWLPHS